MFEQVKCHLFGHDWESVEQGDWWKQSCQRCDERKHDLAECWKCGNTNSVVVTTAGVYCENCDFEL